MMSLLTVPPPGKQVDELQDELTNLLFGQEPASLNITDQLANRVEFDDDYSEEYNYQDKITSRKIAEDDHSDAPIAVRSF